MTAMLSRSALWLLRVPIAVNAGKLSSGDNGMNQWWRVTRRADLNMKVQLVYRVTKATQGDLAIAWRRAERHPWFHLDIDIALSRCHLLSYRLDIDHGSICCPHCHVTVG